MKFRRSPGRLPCERTSLSDSFVWCKLMNPSREQTPRWLWGLGARVSHQGDFRFLIDKRRVRVGCLPGTLLPEPSGQLGDNTHRLVSASGGCKHTTRSLGRSSLKILTPLDVLGSTAFHHSAMRFEGSSDPIKYCILILLTPNYVDPQVLYICGYMYFIYVDPYPTDCFWHEVESRMNYFLPIGLSSSLSQSGIRWEVSKRFPSYFKAN